MLTKYSGKLPKKLPFLSSCWEVQSSFKKVSTVLKTISCYCLSLRQCCTTLMFRVSRYITVFLYCIIFVLIHIWFTKLKWSCSGSYFSRLKLRKLRNIGGWGWVRTKEKWKEYFQENRFYKRMACRMISPSIRFDVFCIVLLIKNPYYFVPCWHYIHALLTRYFATGARKEDIRGECKRRFSLVCYERSLNNVSFFSNSKQFGGHKPCWFSLVANFWRWCFLSEIKTILYVNPCGELPKVSRTATDTPT